MRRLLQAGRSRTRQRVDDGMTTAEYAVGTLAACGFAAVLLRVVTSEAVRNLISGVIVQALGAAG